MPITTAADNIHKYFFIYLFFFFFFFFSEKIRLDVSSESSARQRIHMKYQVLFSRQRIHMKHQVLFSLKNNVKVFMNVVCCSRDWRFKG